jgi:hypothetical protein
LRRQHRGDALRREGFSALVEVPLSGQRLGDRPQAGTPLPLGLGEILRPLDDLWARFGVALATVDLDSGRALAPARRRQFGDQRRFLELGNRPQDQAHDLAVGVSSMKYMGDDAAISVTPRTFNKSCP